MMKVRGKARVAPAAAAHMKLPDPFRHILKGKTISRKTIKSFFNGLAQNGFASVFSESRARAGSV
jgi:hypothetical protein